MLTGLRERFETVNQKVLVGGAALLGFCATLGLHFYYGYCTSRSTCAHANNEPIRKAIENRHIEVVRLLLADTYQTIKVAYKDSSIRVDNIERLVEDLLELEVEKCERLVGGWLAITVDSNTYGKEILDKLESRDDLIVVKNAISLD